MSNVTFSIAKSFVEYERINSYVNFVFSKSFYGDNCIILEDLSLFNVFEFYYNNQKDYSYFNYINSKCALKEGFLKYIDDQNIYLNYYNKNIYFLKYDKFIYNFFDIFKDDLSDQTFFKFLNNYYFCFKKNINFYLEHKIVYPKTKLLYNAGYEKFKNKKHKST